MRKQERNSNEIGPKSLMILENISAKKCYTPLYRCARRLENLYMPRTDHDLLHVDAHCMI